jgi:hypothetical protein
MADDDMGATVPAPSVDDEAARLAALYDTGILDTAPDPDFDAVAQLASQICGTPMALVSLVDSDRQWSKAKVACTRSRPAAMCRSARIPSPAMTSPVHRDITGRALRDTLEYGRDYSACRCSKSAARLSEFECTALRVLFTVGLAVDLPVTP